MVWLTFPTGPLPGCMQADHWAANDPMRAYWEPSHLTDIECPDCGCLDSSGHLPGCRRLKRGRRAA